MGIGGHELLHLVDEDEDLDDDDLPYWLEGPDRPLVVCRPTPPAGPARCTPAAGSPRRLHPSPRGRVRRLLHRP